MICWFFLVPAGVPVFVSLLLSSLVPVLISLLFFFSFRTGVLFHHDLLVPLGSGRGSGACLPFFSLLCFRSLSPFFSLLSFLKKGVLFHHDLLVPPGSGSGSSACLPSSFSFLFSGKGFCSIMIYCFLLVPAGLRCLSPFFSLLSSGKGFCSIIVCWFFLVPARVPVLVSLLLPSFFPQENGSVPS